VRPYRMTWDAMQAPTRPPMPAPFESFVHKPRATRGDVRAEGAYV
jgi:hypothetical protein